MCFVSVMTQAVPNQQQQYVNGQKDTVNPFQQWSLPQATEFKQILDRLDKLDKSLGLRDCKDEQKDAVISFLLKRIQDLEAKDGE